jgi:hypothetical protein
MLEKYTLAEVYILNHKKKTYFGIILKIWFKDCKLLNFVDFVYI